MNFLKAFKIKMQQIRVIHSFIQSFILDISIVPLQVHYYSEELKTTPFRAFFITKRAGTAYWQIKKQCYEISV